MARGANQREVLGSACSKLPVVLRAAVLSASVILSSACAPPADPSADLSSALPSQPQRFFACLREQGETVIAAHFGGAGPGIPENSMAALTRSAELAPIMLEVDLQATADNVLFLNHDATLDRTTNGAGEIAELDWNDISDLRLQDPDGVPTDERPVLLTTLLDWAQPDVILWLDVKPPLDPVVANAAVRANGSSAPIAYIVYSADDAIRLIKSDPDAMVSLGINGPDRLASLIDAGVAADQIIGFPDGAYQQSEAQGELAATGVTLAIAAQGAKDSFDAAFRASGDPSSYRDLFNGAGTILVTDFPGALAAARQMFGAAETAPVCTLNHSEKG